MRAAAAAPSRRQQSKWQREQLQQHTLYIAVGALIALIVAIFAGGYFYDNVVRANAVVAQIGPDSVTASQLADEMRPRVRVLDAQFKQLGSRPNTTQLENRKRAMPDQTLNDLIDERLIAQEAARRGIGLTASDVDDKLRQTVAEFEAATNPAPIAEPTSTPEGAPSAEPTGVATSSMPTPMPTLEASAYASALQKLLERNNLTEADLRKNLEHSLLRERVQKAMDDESPTAQEQLRARHILVDTQEQANDVLARLEGGADFAQLAQELSADPGSKDKGGELDWFGREVMDKPFEEAAFALQPGQLSNVVSGTYGYHVIQVLEREANRPVAASELRSQRQRAFTDWLGSRRSSPDVKLQFTQPERDWILGRIGVRP